MKMIKRLGLVILVPMALLVFSFPAAAETLTDRCSGKVRIPPHFNDGPNATGTVELKRNSAGNAGWTEMLTVQVADDDCCSGNIWNSDCGKFRWYCQPPGENKWYDEKSRCSDHSTKIKAALRPDRKVLFDCLGGGTKKKCDNGSSGTSSGGPGEPCAAHDICRKGSVCNLATHKCEAIEISGCGDLGEGCCPPTSADPIGCGSAGQCSDGVCQRCGGEGQLCCGGANVAGGGCAAGFECNGSFCREATGNSQSAITLQAERDPYLGAAFGNNLNVIDRSGAGYKRIYSPDDGKQWYFDATESSEGLLVPKNQIGQGLFTSGPASAASADGKQLHVFGRGNDNKIWRAFSPDGGTTWTLAWAPIGQGVFTSAPAAAVSADGKQLHVFGRGNDNKIWRAFSPDGGTTWTLAWAPIGQGVFTSAPTAAVSADGKQVHVFGRGNDNKIWRAFSPDGGTTWTVAWKPIGEGLFTSAPAAAISADGKQLHVFGRGNDGRVWRALSLDGGATWQIAWLPVGEKTFSSGPTAVVAGDGNKLHVFGRGTEAPGFGFSEPPIMQAFSSDGGAHWNMLWTPINPQGRRLFTGTIKALPKRVLP